MLQEVKVVEYQKNGQKDIDNHSSQHYNVKQFCGASHVCHLGEMKKCLLIIIERQELSRV